MLHSLPSYSHTCTFPSLLQFLKVFVWYYRSVSIAMSLGQLLAVVKIDVQRIIISCVEGMALFSCCSYINICVIDYNICVRCTYASNSLIEDWEWKQLTNWLTCLSVSSVAKQNTQTWASNSLIECWELKQLTNGLNVWL